MITLRCGRCGLPWARLVDGKLIVDSRHHGEHHSNQVTLEDLEKMCQTERSTPDDRAND